MSILDQLEQNLETAKETHKSEETTGGTGRKFAIGIHIVGRLIPYMAADGTPRFIETMYFHYYNGTDDKWHFMYCPKNHGWDETCEICDYVKGHYDEFGSDGVYNNFKRKRKYKTNFYVSSVKKMTGANVDDAVIKAWEEVVGTVIEIDFPWTLKEKIDVALEDSELGTSIYNPLSGYDMNIRVTEKKTDDGTFPNYDTSDFGRTKGMISGCEGREDLEKVLGEATDLKAIIAREVEKDRPKIRPAAIDESLIVDDGSPAAPAGEKKTDKSAPAKTETTKESASAQSDKEEPGKDAEEQKVDDTTTEEGGEEEGGLASIFAKYRD